MILHLVRFERKFTPYFIQLNEKLFPGNSIYLCYDSDDISELMKIDPRILPGKSKTQEGTFKDLKISCHKVIVHHLDKCIESFVISIPRPLIVALIHWGQTEYDDPYKYKPDFVYDTMTHNFIKGLGQTNIKHLLPERLFNLFLPSYLREFYRKFRIKQHYLHRKKAVQRFDLVMHFNRIEVDLLAKTYDIAKIPHDLFIYHSINDDNASNPALIQRLIKEIPGFIDKKILIVGHSGYPSVNHLDVFYHLKQFSLNDHFLIVCPLGYGDPQYTSEIIKLGSKILGDLFVPIQEFIELSEYNYLLKISHAGIFNVKQSSAAGNIFKLIYEGKKIFINSGSPIFTFLKGHQVKVFSFPEELNSYHLKMELTSEERSVNKSFFDTNFNQHQVEAFYKKMNKI